VWVTIGFTYDEWKRKYCLLKERDEEGLCLACTSRLNSNVNAFCYRCKSPRPLDWTTGNKSLDSFIMESWKNTMIVDDAYIEWIEYSRFSNMQEMTSLRHGCTHIADLTMNYEMIRVTLKMIEDNQSSDFHQVNAINAIDKCVRALNNIVITVYV